MAGYTGKVPFLVPDPHLRWRPLPGYRSESPSRNVRIDARGFRDGLANAKENEPARALQVICLGDSCTFGPMTAASQAPFPELLFGLLKKNGKNARVINAGVPGYSVFQGVGWFRQVVVPLRPDVVAVYFGWNDHWENSSGRTDPQEVDTLRAWFLCLRGVQCAKTLWFSLQTPGNSGNAPDDRTAAVPIDRSRLRVPPALYSGLLATLVGEIRRAGARPILLTAPCGLSSEHAGRIVPFGAGSEAPHRVLAEHYINLHGQYQRLTREIAARLGCDLLDLETRFKTAGKARLFDDPLEDPIHPNATGYALIAQALAAMILEGPERVR